MIITQSFYFSLFFLFTTISFSAQKNSNKDKFTETVGQQEGDLNDDEKADQIIVSTIKTGDIKPFKLEILLSQPNNSQLKSAASSVKILEQQYVAEKYGMKKNFRVPDIFIENGKLTILTDINGLKSRYVFRYHKGHFELTNISRIRSDGREKTTETEIDLLKGTKLVYEQDFGPNKKYKVREKFKPKALPKIQDLTASDLAKY